MAIFLRMQEKRVFGISRIVRIDNTEDKYERHTLMETIYQLGRLSIVIRFKDYRKQ